ncbi:chaperone [Escherichia coli]|nr:chaperone [Escherichia coli]
MRSAEESKIALSSVAETRASLPFISDELATLISQQGLESALSQPLTRILEQVQLALDNAQEKPDVIYLTGGSARSPLIKKALAEQLPGIPIAAAMTLAPSPPGWHAGGSGVSLIEKWLSSGLNLPAPEPVFLPPDVTVPSTAWSVLEHEGGIAATLSRRQSTPIPADVVWRPFSPLPLVFLQALPLRSA